MSKSKVNRLSATVFCVSIALAALPAAADIEAITKPSQDVTLSFVHPGLVAEVAVKEGDTVEKDQMVVKQDDREEVAVRDQAKAQAEDDTRVAAQKATLDQKKVDEEKFKWALKNSAATTFEVDHAHLDVVIADLSLKLADFEHQQDQRKYDESKIHVDQAMIRSPIAGLVEQTLVKAGESVEQQTKVIRIVSIDPLWIEVPAPLEVVRTLKPGSEANVKFDDMKDAVKGKITFIAAVADAASNTRLVRVEVPNTGNTRPAGERVQVDFGVKIAQK
jgi:multidrug efflux system membrane fusion protein